MTTFNTIKKPKINFTMVPNEVLLDPRLTLKAKGLWVYFLSRPEGWQFSIDRLCSTMKEGKKAIKSAIKELEDADYLERKANYNKQAQRLEGYQYTLKFEGEVSKTQADTKGGRQESSSPTKGSAINNTEDSKKDLSNNDSSSIADEPKGSPAVDTKKNKPINKSYTLAVDVYFEFYKKNSGGEIPKFYAAEGSALKSILAHFRKIAPEEHKTIEEKAEYAVSCLTAIFTHWNKLSEWQQRNPDIKIINSQLNNIITALKNGKATTNPNSKVPVRSSDWVD